MKKQGLSRNYFVILNTFFKYLPSRFFIILNSLILIPFFAYFLSEKEMGLFQLCIGILNLVCTCSTDWIAKSVLRFWVKYKEQKTLDNFFSNVLVITLISYVLIFLSYLLFADLISQKLLISKSLLFLTLFLVVPCGIRQILYQLLRIFDKPFLYTFSIIFYQISLLLLFMISSSVFSNVYSILIAMGVSVLVLDFYILKQLGLGRKIEFSINSKMLRESLKYSLPLVITNISIWSILNVNKFIFQYNHDFINTAKVGLCAFFTANFLSVFFSTFLFSVFPVIISKFEKQAFIKSFVSNTIQLYFVIFVPVIGLFCFFSKELTMSLLSIKYTQAHLLLPFYALALFGHELLKLINIKYHLKNRTYIEMIFSILVGSISLVLNILLLQKYGLLAAGIIVLFSIMLLLILNSSVKFTSIDYLDNKLVLKTGLLSVFIAVVTFLVVHFVFSINNSVVNSLFLVKIVSFFGLYYFILWKFRHSVLR